MQLERWSQKLRQSVAETEHSHLCQIIKMEEIEMTFLKHEKA